MLDYVDYLAVADKRVIEATVQNILQTSDDTLQTGTKQRLKQLAYLASETTCKFCKLTNVTY